MARRPDNLGFDIGETRVHEFCELRVCLCEGEDGCGIGAVDGEAAELAGLRVAVNMRRGGDTGFFVEPAESDGVVDAVLGHVAIGCPLPSRNGEQTGVIDVDRVVARDRRCLAITRGGLRQRANADKNAEDVVARGLAREITSRSFEDEVDLFFEWERFIGDGVDWCVGSTNERTVVPWNSEEDPAIVGMGYEKRGVSREEG